MSFCLPSVDYLVTFKLLSLRLFALTESNVNFKMYRSLNFIDFYSYPYSKNLNMDETFGIE